MGKRFGRNKRREMRNRIAVLEDTIANNERRLSDMYKLEQEMEMWDRRVRDLLGADSGYARSPRQHPEMEYHHDTFRMTIHDQPIPWYWPCTSIGVRLAQFDETMHKVEIAADQDFHKHAARLHLIVSGTHEATYYISDSMLGQVGIDAKAREILGSIAVQKLAGLYNSKIKPTNE